MAELLVKAVSAAVLSDATKDQRGCYKRGMPVVVMPDGHTWGLRERLPNFVVLKFPLIAVDRVEKFIQADQTTVNGETTVVRRRLFRIAWASLPPAAQNKLLSTGELVIRATASYTGPFDYTWTQVRDYFVNQSTGLAETGSL